MKSLRKSVWAVTLGVILAMVVAVLVVFGILAPLFTVFMGEGRFGLERTGPTALPIALLIFAAGFSFYWGGMISSYKAPGRRKLHGTLVAPAAFVISPVINVLSGNEMFPGLETSGTVMLMLGFLLAAFAGAFVGAIRGEAVHAYNQVFIEREQRRSRGEGG